MPEVLRVRLGEDAFGRFVALFLDNLSWAVFTREGDFIAALWHNKQYVMTHDAYLRCLDHFQGRKGPRDA